MARKNSHRRHPARAATKPSTTSPQDPFAGIKPVKDFSALLGGLPDDRTAEEILADLRSMRRGRRRPK